MAGRTTVDAPPIGCVLTLNDGMTVRSWSFRSPPPCRTRSVAVSTSTGTADSVALRASAREPTTTVSSVKPARRPCISAGDSPSASTSAGVMPSARARSWSDLARRFVLCLDLLPGMSSPRGAALRFGYEVGAIHTVASSAGRVRDPRPARGPSSSFLPRGVRVVIFPLGAGPASSSFSAVAGRHGSLRRQRARL